ncbi:MAG: DUF507 family protein [Deltaproteobacteria bacterium]|nr:DUF507 family protein [Deltaproteobacteria bacterium]
MSLTSDRAYFLSNIIMDYFVSKSVHFLRDEATVKREIRRGLEDYIKFEEEVDRKVRAKISSLSRQVYEGSSEWETLYRKYFQEEVELKTSF